MSIPTVQSLRRQAARIDRYRLAADRVVATMRREHLDLHCEHDRRRGLVWHLADGTEIPETLAHELVRHPNIKPAGDVLPFGKGERLPCQTYRFHI